VRSSIGLRGTGSKLAIALFALAGLTGAADKLPETKLEAISNDPLTFEHTTVRTCGWASNAFEDVMITTHRHVAREKAVGLGMVWCAGTPRLDEAQACVTGVVQGLGGQDGREIVRGRSKFISTGSPFQWELVQQCPAK
jgi:hypothetical protein